MYIDPFKLQAFARQALDIYTERPAQDIYTERPAEDIYTPWLARFLNHTYGRRRKRHGK